MNSVEVKIRDGASIHLVGIAGVGMSALAELLVACGYVVSGSERFYDSGKDLPVLKKLRGLGIRIFAQDGSGVREGVDCVCASSAIESDNADLCEANKLGISVFKRASLLARVCEQRGFDVVAIAGTCGKSTVTAMVGKILEETGFSPWVVDGAAVTEWMNEDRVGAVRVGNGNIAVLEVDESDKSLLEFTPKYAVVTNSSSDHFSQEETDKVFDKFLSQVTGCFVDGRRGELASLTIDGVKGVLCDIKEGDWSTSFVYKGVVFSLPMPGLHNVYDAIYATEVAKLLGVSYEQSANALMGFRGVDRRMTSVGVRSQDGVRIVDEYAHNTEKIREAIKTLKKHSTRCLLLWRPHGYGPLRNMFADLVDMFDKELSDSDILWVLPVFDAGGTANRDIQSDSLVEALCARGKQAVYVINHEEAITQINDNILSGDIVCVFGARDPDLSVTARRLLDEQ